MAKFYSLDLRRRVFALLNKGESKLFIEKIVGVSTKTILKWQRRYEETGLIDRIIPTVTRPRSLNYERVEKFIEKNPDKTLEEIGKRFNVTDMGIYYIVKQLNITYKKTLPIRGKAGRFAKRISKDTKENS